MNVNNSAITGDIVVESGDVDIALSNSSVLSGAVVGHDGKRANSITLDSNSIWNVRGSSIVASLNNEGAIIFTPPVNAVFKELVVNEYKGNGSLTLNTSLGGDNSPTDKLIIDGGKVAGKTALTLINSGGSGGDTEVGIPLIRTINGATTSKDSFYLHEKSIGYRGSTGTVAAHGYDYSLLRGGHGGVKNDWYLVSNYIETIDPVAPVPDEPINPKPDPVAPVYPKPGSPGPGMPPPGLTFHNISPESGAYAGNTIAGRQMFAHHFHDRAPAIRNNDADGAGNKSVWVRMHAQHDRDLSMRKGQVDIDTNQVVMQLGGDILQRELGQSGRLHFGLMGGYGDARTHSTSTFRLPALGGLAMDVKAHGETSGYAVGLYTTLYEKENGNSGAYGDVWVQYGRLRNSIHSELGNINYDANLWLASLEAGYALQPFSSVSALRNVVIAPNAQVIYSNYRAENAVLQDVRMRHGSADAWHTRVGVRVYSMEDENASFKLRPFMEINWLYNDNPSVLMGSNEFKTSFSRNAGQLKVGTEGDISQSLQLSAQVFGQAGEKGQHSYGGRLALRYHW